MSGTGQTHKPPLARGAWLALFLVGLFGVGCGILDPDDDHEREPKPGETTVLFIGSSYLAFNDVPKRFEEMAQRGGHAAWTKRYTRLGQPLAFHASNSGTAYVLRQRDWDFVVLQGGAQDVAYPRGAENPVQPALRELYRKATEDSPDTRVIWMMPWAYEDGMLWVEGRTEDYPQMQLDIREKTLEWADEENLVIAPVGMAFYEVLTEWDPGIHFLHDEDWNHASEAGSYLAAATFYSTIYAESCSDVEYSWKVQKSLARDLREVASTTVLTDLDAWNIDWGGGD